MSMETVREQILEALRHPEPTRAVFEGEDATQAIIVLAREKLCCQTPLGIATVELVYAGGQIGYGPGPKLQSDTAP